MLVLFSAALFAFAWLIPNHYTPWLAAWGDGCALAGGVLLVLWAAYRKNTGLRVSWPLTVAAGIAAAAIAWQLSTGRLVFAGDALMAVFYVGAWVSAVAVGRLIAGEPDDHALATIATAWLLAAIASVGIALVQWTGAIGLGIYAANLQPAGRPFANLGQPNHLATLCFIGLCCLGWLHERARVRLSVLALGSTLMLLGIAMSQSRTGWLQVGLLVVWLLAMRGRTALRLSRGQALVLGAAFVLLVLSWSSVAEALLLSRGRTAEETAAAGTRTAHWQMMVDAIGREPWWGYGWQQVSAAQQRVALDHPWVGEQIDSSHNLVLDLLVWNGIPIGAVIIVALTVWVVIRIRQCRDGRAAWFLALVGGVFVHAMLEYPLQYAYFLVPVGLAMGIVEAASVPASGLRISRAAMYCAAGLMGLVLVLVTSEYFEAEEDDRTVRLESARIGTNRIVTPAPELKLLTQLGAYLAFIRIEPAPGMGIARLESMREVAERYGYHPLMFRYAVAAGLNEQPEIAASTLARICRIHTKRQCVDTRNLWIATMRDQYPQLSAVALPPLP
jgi:hypothetical protein